MKIGLIIAIERELKSFLENGSAIETLAVGSMTVYRTELYGHEVLAVRSGYGEIDAAAATQLLITWGGCETVLNFGVTGALDPLLRVEELFVVRRVCHYDYDVSPIDPVRKHQYAEFPDEFIPLDPDLILAYHTQGGVIYWRYLDAEPEGARELGLRFLIDGAQALGGMPVDVKALGCDLYAFPGHKSLLGPQGTGGLYIAPGAALNPLREGGTGTGSESLAQPEELPERYESGTVNLPGIAGLGAGCAYVRGRLSQIMMRERELTSALCEGLANIPGVVLYTPRQEAGRAAIACFNVGDLSSSQVADALARRDIAVRGGLHCAPGAHRFLGTLERGAVRASLGHANTFEEVERFLRAVREIARG